MEPRIRYAKTTDGVNIAYWALGKHEPALVCFSPLLWTNIALEWEIPGLRRWYEHLASSRMLVRFDTRGTGRSQRGVDDYSLDALVSDVEAVVDGLGLERFDLLAFGEPAERAIAFAARHPKDVSRLVLWGSTGHQQDEFGGPGRFRALLALAETDWDLAMESWAHATVGWGRGKEAHQWAAFIRATIDQKDFSRMLRQIWRSDVTALLSQVAAQTLIIEPRPSQRSSTLADHSTALAAGIPHAVVARLGPGPPAPYEHVEGVRIVEEFLELTNHAAKAAPHGMTAILFADIVDSTALTERLGDAAFRDKARVLDAALRTVIRDNAGTPIEGKLLGDGVLAVFTSARQAIQAALACGRAGTDGALPLHLGLHAGDVIREDNNVYGGAVNIAARISGLSAPGEVLVSDTVRSLARTSSGVEFEDRGEQPLKGVGEPVRVWAVREAE